MGKHIDKGLKPYITMVKIIFINVCIDSIYHGKDCQKCIKGLQICAGNADSKKEVFTIFGGVVKQLLKNSDLKYIY